MCADQGARAEEYTANRRVKKDIGVERRESMRKDSNPAAIFVNVLGFFAKFVEGVSSRFCPVGSKGMILHGLCRFFGVVKFRDVFGVVTCRDAFYIITLCASWLSYFDIIL